MGSCVNFENVGSMAPPEGKTTVSYPLARQGSIYSMTFDELQTMGSLGRDFGSMNMEELLKNLWTAEETQTNAIAGGTGNVPYPGGNLQRQGSLTLPRTISQKTVDDVWKDLLKESVDLKDETDGRLSNMFQREPTLGEMTLEEFLARAGVVREEIQPIEKPSNAFGDFTHMNQPIEKPSNARYSDVFTQTNGHNNGFTIDFQQLSPNKGILGNQNVGNNNEFSFNLSLNGNRLRSPRHQQHLQSHTQLQPLSPKQSTVPLASPQPTSSRVTSSVVGMANGLLNSSTAVTHHGVMNMTSSAASPQPTSSRVTSSVVGMANGLLNSSTAVTHHGVMNMTSSGVTSSVVGMANTLNSPSAVSNNGMTNVASSGVTNSVGMANSSLSSPTPLAHGGLVNMAGLRGVTTTVPGGSPLNHLHPDTSSKSTLDSPSLSSSPYAYNEGGQGRRSSATLEKQVERRHRRMIKNRESAARSRARKQAYITLLEAEIDKLKEINRELIEKQVELMDMQKDQAAEPGREGKRRCIRRTLTGPW